MRSNKGPQRQWLHRISKADSPLCQCGAIQSGEHIVFTCPQHHIAREALLGPDAHTWESLDPPRYHQEDEDQETNLMEEFFSYIHAHFS